ncbi:MAG: hypothetical protein BRC27_01685 [Nanohaloarchaea archaeon SW_10_44_10]|nr:MAG: hypothetical protein BRC27_01685 [Nanohaloarchaea archaeon SW_10_44_10]
MSRTKQRIMSKSEFESRKEKFRDVDSSVEKKMSAADSDERFAIKLKEGSSFKAIEAKRIESTEDLMKAMRKN